MMRASSTKRARSSSSSDGCIAFTATWRRTSPSIAFQTTPIPPRLISPSIRKRSFSMAPLGGSAGTRGGQDAVDPGPALERPVLKDGRRHVAVLDGGSDAEHARRQRERVREARDAEEAPERRPYARAVVLDRDVDEPGRQRMGAMLFRRVEVGDHPAVEPRAHDVLRGSVERARGAHVLGDDEAAARPEDARRLAVERALVGGVAEALERPHGVERARAEGDRRVVGLEERGARHAAGRGKGTGPRRLAPDERDPDGGHVLVAREPEGTPASAAPGVEDARPGPNAGAPRELAVRVLERVGVPADRRVVVPAEVEREVPRVEPEPAV